MFSGKKLKLVRIRAGLQQTELAEKLKCNSTEIWRYEKGRTQPRPERVVEIANILGVKPDELTIEEPDPSAFDSPAFIDTPFTGQEREILRSVLTLPPIRQAKVIGYLEGFIASGSHQAATAASQLSEAASQAGRSSPKPEDTLAASR
ncbi:MAG: helix-turn-helix transcriptional regulator [Sedimentisphaerales bacterium]|nr:helix-turn-helix transcriptional regulator [Sedimentisphaerales bacterium]